MPRCLQEGELVHFAIDNVDFQKDTIDGKNTLHATVMVAFQPGREVVRLRSPLRVNFEQSGSLPPVHL